MLRLSFAGNLLCLSPVWGVLCGIRTQCGFLVFCCTDSISLWFVPCSASWYLPCRKNDCCLFSFADVCCVKLPRDDYDARVDRFHQLRDLQVRFLWFTLREREREKDRQTNRQRDRQTDKQTDSQNVKRSEWGISRLQFTCAANQNFLLCSNFLLDTRPSSEAWEMSLYFIIKASGNLQKNILNGLHSLIQKQRSSHNVPRQSIDSGRRWFWGTDAQDRWGRRDQQGTHS